MELVANPFFLLRLGAQSTRQDIIEAAESLSLAAESEEYAKSRAILTHPRNRIAAELAWLPGVAPNLALMLADRVKSAPQAISEALPKLPPLARCNLAAMLLASHRVKDAKLTSWLHFLAKAYDEINVEELTATLNEDRQTAGFAPIPSGESIEAELNERRVYLAHVMRDALDKVAEPDIVMTALVETATDKGQKPAPALIDELVDKYHIEVQKYLDQLEEQIRQILEIIRSSPKAAFEQRLSLLEEKVRSWGVIARPIQILMQSKGLDDETSGRLANQLRDTALFMANEHGMHTEAFKINGVMADVFKDLPLLSNALSEDSETLKRIIKNKESGGVDEQWAKDIELDLAMGLIFKDKLSIDANSIRYKGKSIKTQDVDRVRWGGLVQYVNGIKASTQYTIWIGSPKGSIRIECSKFFQRGQTAERNFQLILEKLWLAVCVRLVNTTLARLSRGEKIRYGDIVVDKDGVTLRRRKFFLFTVPYHASWEDLRIGNGKGTFFIESASQKGANAHLVYRDIENVHILEKVMRFLWQDGNLARFRAGQYK